MGLVLIDPIHHFQIDLEEKHLIMSRLKMIRAQLDEREGTSVQLDMLEQSDDI